MSAKDEKFSAPVSVEKKTKSNRRKGKKKPAAAEPESAVASLVESKPWSRPESKFDTGVSGMLKTIMSKLTVNQKPERSFYYVNLRSVVRVALFFDVFLRRYSRRQPGWMAEGYYAALYVRALIVKLQAVSLVNGTLAFNSSAMLSSNFEIPSALAMLVDQFGIKTDVNNVELAPLVTDALLARLATLVSRLETTVNRVALAYNYMINVNHWQADVFWSYGVWPWLTLCLMRLAARLRLGSRAVSSAAEFSDTFALMIQDYRRVTNMANLNPAARAAVVAEGALLQQWLTPPHGVAVYASAAAGVPAAVNDAINALLTFGVDDPVPAPVALADIRIMRDLEYLGTERVELGQRFSLKPVSNSSIGSFAPLVSCNVTDGYTSGSTPILSVSPQEYVIGMVLDNRPDLCSRLGFPFNIHDASRRAHRNYSSEVAMNPEELLSNLLTEGAVLKMERKAL
jgi:hypothetical protein